MNLLSNSTIMNASDPTAFNSITYFSFEFWLLVFGSTIYIDTLLFLIIPLMSVFGLVINLIGFRVLLNEQFKSLRLYAYLRVYLLNSCCLCLIMIGIFVSSRRYVSALNNYYSYFFISHIFAPIVVTCYSYAGVLDIVILLDRISMLTRNKINFINKLSTNMVCLIAFIFNIFLTFTWYYALYPNSLTVDLSSTEAYTFHFFDLNNFTKSELFFIIRLVQTVLRDLIVTLAQVGLNCVSINLLKKHLIKKSKMLNNSTAKSLQSGLEKGSTKNQEKSNTISVINNNDAIKNIAESNTINRQRNIDKADQRATIMVTLISIISILEHSFAFTVAIYLSIVINLISYSLSATSDAIYTFKHISSFFLLLAFNKNFKEGVINFLKRKN
jgi:hypothetical protein